MAAEVRAQTPPQYFAEDPRFLGSNAGGPQRDQVA
jgi:hypothetical protein